MLRVRAKGRDHVAEGRERLVDEAGLVDPLRILLGLRDSLATREVDEIELGDQFGLVLLALSVLGKEKRVLAVWLHVHLDLENGVTARALGVAGRL